MNNTESRLREEYGGMLVNMRKPGEALMIGADTAVMVIRVIGNQVRLGVTSKTRQSVLREEKFRENQAARASEGVKTYHPFYRLGGSYYLSSDSGGEQVPAEEGVGVVISRFDSLLEAYAYVKGVQLAWPDAQTDVDLQHRDAYVLVNTPTNLPFRFIDHSNLI